MGWGVNDFPSPPEPRYPRCPICGEECETVYQDSWGNIVGCDECVTTLDAWEYLEQEER